MPVELNITESVTELDTTVVTVTLESASEPGPAGPGVAAGGTVGQVLTKDSSTDFDTSWQDPTGGSGVDDADYLVGTAHPDLTSEIVVGTTPGGELGGTWASPTVDATHSGSSHADVQAAAEATAASALTTHSADTTAVHGITDTSALALTANHPSNATFNDHSARHENGGADEISIAGLDGTPTELTNHLNDTSAAHAASAISADSTTLVGTGTDVQAVLEELDNGIADHIADATAAHAATAISFTPDGSISATTVQAAIVEVRDEAGGGGAPTDATFITQTPNGSLSNEQALSALSTGIVKVTTTTGVLSTAVSNTDYAAATHASRHQDGGADEISIANLDGTPTELANHLADTSDAHDASAISIADAGGFFAATDVEAALQEIGPQGLWTEIIKASTESVSSATTGTTLQADDELVIPAGGTGLYEFHLVFMYSEPANSGTPDIKWNMAPASGGHAAARHAIGVNTSFAIQSAGVVDATNITHGADSTVRMTIVHGFVDIFTNVAYNFQWAQNTSSANNLSVHAGSYLRYRKLA